MPLAEENRRPVVLVHGIFDTARKMRKLAAHLAAEGFQTYAPSLQPSNSTVGLEVLAAQLRDGIEARFGPDAPIHLVGFSMGGLITRYYLQRLGGGARVRHYITISAPHRGSWWAWCLPTPACRQMRPGSDFLQDLDRDFAVPKAGAFTSVWTPFDLMILPAHSSRTAIGTHHRLPVLLHPWMVARPRCLRLVAQVLAREIAALTE